MLLCNINRELQYNDNRKKQKVKLKLVYKKTYCHRYESDIVKFYTLIPIMEENLTRGRSMHLMHKNTCENKSHNDTTELSYLL